MGKNSGGTRNTRGASMASATSTTQSIDRIAHSLVGTAPTFVDRNNEGANETAAKIVSDTIERLNSLSQMARQVNMAEPRNVTILQGIAERYANDMKSRAHRLETQVTVFSGDKYGMRKTQSQDYDKVNEFRRNIDAAADKLRKVYKQ